MISAYIGIDPGQKGGIAILRNNKPPFVKAMPIVEDTVDGYALATYLRSTLYDDVIGMLPCKAWIEKLWGVPGWSSKALFNYGENYGALKGVLSALAIPFDTVAPRTWKQKILEDSNATKTASLEYCYKNFPDLEIGKHDGKSDSLCIARYGISITA